MKVRISQNNNFQKKNKTFKEFSDDLLTGIDSIPNNQLLFLIKAKLYEYFKYKVNALQLDNPEQEKYTLMVVNNVLLELKPSLIENGLKTKSEIKIFIAYLKYELDIRGFIINEDELYSLLEQIAKKIN